MDLVHVGDQTVRIRERLASFHQRVAACRERYALVRGLAQGHKRAMAERIRRATLRDPSVARGSRGMDFGTPGSPQRFVLADRDLVLFRLRQEPPNLYICTAAGGVRRRADVQADDRDAAVRAFPSRLLAAQALVARR